MNDLEKLFVSELKDLYDCEQQLVKALPEMEKNASSGQLKTVFHEHLAETKNHVNRLERVFKTIGETPKRKSCKAMEGIIDEGQMVAAEFSENSALDAALIAAGQKAEHYEITSYGSLRAWANELGKQEIVDILEETLAEEKQADQKLNRLAKEALNREATMHDQDKSSEFSASIKKFAAHGA